MTPATESEQPTARDRKIGDVLGQVCPAEGRPAVRWLMETAAEQHRAGATSPSLVVLPGGWAELAERSCAGSDPGDVRDAVLNVHAALTIRFNTKRGRGQARLIDGVCEPGDPMAGEVTISLSVLALTAVGVLPW